MNESIFLLAVVMSTALVIISLPIINRLIADLKVPDGNRYGMIDGLRGFLAIFVFFHHFYIFYFWKINGKWTSPDVFYIEKLGVASVSIFFMITGFLFINKIKSLNVDWAKLFISRVFRIVPLYLVVVVVTIFYSFFVFDFHLKVSFLTLIKDILKWCLFIGDDVNSYSDARRVTAGVTWTLKYEWLFYFSLPFLLLFLKNKYCALLLILLSFILYFNNIHLSPFFESKYLVFFMYGGLASYLHTKIFNSFRVQDFIRSKLSSVFSLMCLIYMFASNRSIFDIDVSLAGFIFFIFVVLGNDLFGVLRLFSSRLLGEISYSVYLLHGIIIYTLFNFIPAFNLSTSFYFLLLMPITSVLVCIISVFSFKFIEQQCISTGKKISLKYCFMNKPSSNSD
ncbi:acyltransferase [Klebsiella quasipneumoniae]|uniref:acyltransferase family protein n=1 Tax=Klebsiella quasipneumoniae TaxID=1463165 RepID=UPI0029D56A51|nr:acyltransferase [Klebsiella quasipneumoniae]MDX6814851.1 acyltransferase [Klebsiella quasipneumoniae]